MYIIPYFNYSQQMKVEQQEEAISQIQSNRLQLQIAEIKEHPAYHSQLNQKQICLAYKTAIKLHPQTIRTPKSKENYHISKFILFKVCIPDKYPIEGPKVYCLTPILFPRLDDGRDYLENILKSEYWWPTISLCELATKIENFLIKIEEQFIYSPDEPIFAWGKRPPYINIKSLSQINGIKTIEGKQTHLKKNKEITIGLSWSSIVLFKKSKTDESRLMTDLVLPIEKITMLSLKEKQRCSKTQEQKKQKLNTLVQYELKIKIANQSVYLSFQGQNFKEKATDLNGSVMKFCSDRNLSFDESTQLIHLNSVVSMIEELSNYILSSSQIQSESIPDSQKIQHLSKEIQEAEELTLVYYYKSILKSIIDRCYQLPEY